MSYEEEKQDRKIEQLGAEIERLREENAGLSKAVIDIQEERDLAQAEFRAYHKAWEEGAARIKDLEHQLDTRSQEITGRIQECHACQAEGKIGSGDHIGEPTKTMAWQVTEERKAALETAEFAVSHLAGCYPDCERILGKPDQRVAKVLRAMLEEVGQ